MFESITNSAFGGHCSLLHFVKESVINFNSYSLAHLIICPIDLFAMCNEAHIPALDNLVRLLVLFFLLVGLMVLPFEGSFPLSFLTTSYEYFNAQSKCKLHNMF